MIGQPVSEMASDLAEAPSWLGSLIEQINNVKASVTEQISSMNDKVDSVLRTVDDINEFKKSAENRVGELEGSVNFLSKSYDVMLTDQKKMQNTCDTILIDNEILKLRVDTYEREIEDLQQYCRRNCILIHGISEERQENTDELALDIFNNKLGLQSWTKLDGTPCHMAEKRLLLHPSPLFNVAVMLSRTLTYMLTYNIDLGDGGEGKWPYRTDKVI